MDPNKQRPIASLEEARDWDRVFIGEIGIPGATAKDKENRRIPFNPEGRLAAILERRAKLGPQAYVFGSATGEYQSELRDSAALLEIDTNDHRRGSPRATSSFLLFLLTRQDESAA
jgi:hypothetical protein